MITPALHDVYCWIGDEEEIIRTRIRDCLDAGLFFIPIYALRAGHIWIPILEHA